MQLTTITSAIATLLLATNALAAPAPAPASVDTIDTEVTDNTLEARGSTPLIDLWKNKDFLDLKFTGSGDVGACVNLPSKFVDISSSGKAKPGFRCTVWVKKDCKGDGFSFNEKPGSNAFPDWINDKSKSWKCVKA